MSKVSIDIVDQGLSPHRWGFVGPIPCPSPRSDNDRDESQPVTEPDNPPSLIVELTGFHLLNIVSIVVFGMWRVLSSDDNGWITMTKIEVGLVVLAGVIFYYLMILREDCPEICPGFFQVDLAPPIWRFVYRSEVYFFLLSLLPLRPAVSMLRFVLDVRRGLELGDQIPAGSHTVARNALLTAIVGLIFAMIPILQQLAKVLRLRALHRFLVHDIVMLSFLAAWAVSDLYVLSNAMTSVDYTPEEDDEYLFGHTVTMISFALLLPRIEGSIIGALWFRLLKGTLVVVVLTAWGLSEKLRDPYYILFVCGVMIFIILRFSTAAIATLLARKSSNRHRSVQGGTDSLW